MVVALFMTKTVANALYKHQCLITTIQAKGDMRLYDKWSVLCFKTCREMKICSLYALEKSSWSLSTCCQPFRPTACSNQHLSTCLTRWRRKKSCLGKNNNVVQEAGYVFVFFF